MRLVDFPSARYRLKASRPVSQHLDVFQRKTAAAQSRIDRIYIIEQLSMISGV